MAEPKEPQVDAKQLREDLREAKERLSGQAENLRFKEYMGDHPYLSLGAAFLSGILLGGSHSAREEIAKAVVDVIKNEVIHRDSKEGKERQDDR